MNMRKSPKITVTVDGKGDTLTLDSFLKVARDALDILNNLEKEITGKNQINLIWEIAKIQKNTPLSMTIEGRATNGHLVEPMEVVKPFYTGLRLVNHKAQKPKHFTNTILKKARSMSTHLEDDITFLKFEVEDEQPLLINRKIIDNIDRLTKKLNPYYKAHTSHEGYLKIIDVHGKTPEMCIYDTLTNEAIKCIFDENIVQELGANITKRIRVFGETTYRRIDHKPTSVEIDFYKILKNNDGLPTLRDLHDAGINITNGLDSVEFVRELRNG